MYLLLFYRVSLYFERTGGAQWFNKLIQSYYLNNLCENFCLYVIIQTTHFARQQLGINELDEPSSDKLAF